MPPSASPPTLRIALAGLGRMGKRHATHLLHKVARAELIAVSTPSATERDWAGEHLAPYGVRIYEGFEEMLEVEGVSVVSLFVCVMVGRGL